MYERIVKRLIERNYHISFAESCTGGLAAAALVGVADASRVLDVSFVTYADLAKVKYLDVQQEAIDRYGVVSEEVAAQMAQGAAAASGAQVGVGITGIAGPGGGTHKKPVGMVCFGFCVDGEVQTYTCRFGDIGRNEVRQKSVEFVYSTLCQIL